MKIGSFFVFLFLLLYSASALAAVSESSCIKCHTDESALKSLFNPPKIDASEGEG